MNIEIVIPIYKPTLDQLEQFSVDCSQKKMPSIQVIFIHPANLDLSFYKNRYPDSRFLPFNPSFFKSPWTYNNLCYDPQLYKPFKHLDYILLLQTDAIIIKNDLDFWAKQNYHYIGAPVTSLINFNLRQIPPFDIFSKFDAFPTWALNGGLSLRSPQAFIDAIYEYPTLTSSFKNAPIGEDYFYTLMGSLSVNFKVANLVTASKFGWDGDFNIPDDFTRWKKFNFDTPPMGFHKWARDKETMNYVKTLAEKY